MLDTIIGVIAPHSCLSCDQEGALLCRPCLMALPPAIRRCYRCERPADSFRTCQPCRAAGSGLRAVYAATPYDGVARDVIWRLKFDRAKAAAAVMAQRMAAVLPEVPPQTVVVPVPTVRQRARRRGYDQAALLARLYARRINRPYAELLQRSGQQEQIGANRQQRQAQLDGSYSLAGRLPSGMRLERQTVILVDDVLTTGSTLEAASRPLVMAGARSIHGLVFAQA